MKRVGEQTYASSNWEGHEKRDVVYRAAGRGCFIVVFRGRSIGVVRHNVVGMQAIKWSATDPDGRALPDTFLYHQSAGEALLDHDRQRRK